MSRRWVRALILLVTIAVTTGVVWRATLNEQARGRMRLAAQHTDARAAEAIFHLWDLRASLHAYVAPGQSATFWSTRARGQLQDVTTLLAELDPATSRAGHPLTAARSAVDALRIAERRALTAVLDEQPLVAGDIIFAEMRDQVDAAVADLSSARQSMARAASAREAGTVNEQSLLAGALAATWIFAIILLTPVPSSRPVPDAGVLQLRETPPPPEAQAPGLTLQDPRPESQAPGPTTHDPGPWTEAPEPKTPDPAWLQALADLTGDIGRVADAALLGPLLTRAAEIVGARGLVVWLVSDDARQLVPVATGGYDERIVSRLGPIAVTDHNLTASAFRTESPARVAAEEATPGAVAVPLHTPSGVSGVLAAEVPADADLDRAAAAAAVVAAQLATLFPVHTPATPEQYGVTGR